MDTLLFILSLSLKIFTLYFAAVAVFVFRRRRKYPRTAPRTRFAVVVAARNVHRAFVSAAALLDLEVAWLWPEESRSLCGCPISPRQLEAMRQLHPEYRQPDFAACFYEALYTLASGLAPQD